MSPQLKLFLLLAPVSVLPSLAAMALLESGRERQALAVLAVHAALGLGLLPFFARFALHVSVFKELAKVCDFAASLRRGIFPEPFVLPVEQEDENLLLRLKRSLNWMLHSLDSREKSLLGRLAETDQARRDMEDASRKDPLTGLGNRRHFEQVLAGLPPVNGCNGASHRLLLLDCDKFKSVNDTYGHLAGDEVLRALADIMQECLRSDRDWAFRLGGDEFAAILACSGEQARLVAERIRERFKMANGRGCTLSMGITSCLPAPGRPANWNTVISRADAAVYEAKGTGGDAVRER
ncbi:Diguanylate cyclase DosC [Fundidesulfovibrio magnetotacticus]|uniref:diguanylate cyclase n=1 Tax=Fundidesulfovibrio magnetotacticus TaxID=2730080 RepID=A0A6V8LP93_9BACT|nr:GGDEF domain-containing protein [Fundidesulfovibrio magnetotacticus]GFK93544.1 Diguanylate cyclase DosC [Fundidesulfovibrio magnetotacticus]